MSVFRAKLEAQKGGGNTASQGKISVLKHKEKTADKTAHCICS